jgi:hypothetical protein
VVFEPVAGAFEVDDVGVVDDAVDHRGGDGEVLTALTEIPQFCSPKFPTPGRFRS